MINFKIIYENMKNPLMDDQIIHFLLECFKDELPIYDVLTIWYTKGLEIKENTRINDPLTKDRLFATIFNIWKTNYTNLSEEDILVNKLKSNSNNQQFSQGQISESKEQYMQELQTLRMHLQKLPDISTLKEYKECVKNPLIAKYGWQDLNDFSPFVHIKSCSFRADDESLDDIEHRLYINPDSKEIENIVLLFINECFQRKTPFYLKYDSNSDRDDPLVIYSDTPHLVVYIDILKSIKKQHPELNVYYPPVVTGNIDNWIGYGSEPNNKDSFHGKRSEVIQSGIANCLINWGNSHGDLLINIDGIDISVQDYVIENISKTVYEVVKRDQYIYGLNSEDFSSSFLLRKISAFISVIIRQMNNGDTSNKDGWHMPLENGKSIYISKYYLLSPYRKLIPFFRESNPDFINEVRKSILEEAEKRGIDKDNFAFDKNVRDKLFRYQEELEQKKRF